MRQALIYPGEDGYWVAECPSLPGCLSQGRTKAEAVANVREAIQLYVAALQADGLPVPVENCDAILVAVWNCLASLVLIVLPLWSRPDSQLSDNRVANIILSRDLPFAQVVVPNHDELDRGIRSAGLNLEQFTELL
jgi:predicted RNase H-like HicB family nuclease